MNTLLFAGVENIDKLESILSAAHRVVVSSADCPIKDRFTSHGFENHKKKISTFES
jgi:quinolinate synthase